MRRAQFQYLRKTFRTPSSLPRFELVERYSLRETAGVGHKSRERINSFAFDGEFQQLRGPTSKTRLLRVSTLMQST